MEKGMEQRLDKIETRLDKLEKNVNVLIETISTGFEKVGENFKKIDIRFKQADRQMAIMNAKIDSLNGDTTKSLKSVDGKLEDLKTEIKKINKITGYSGMDDNMKVVSR